MFCVKGTVQEGQKFYFRKDSVKYSAGADVKWSLTNKATFDHCITVTNTVGVDVGDSAGFQYNDEHGKGFYISANCHYGATVDVKTQWAYHDTNGDSISAWGSVSEGPGGNVSGCAGVWYDKDGDLHIKFGLSGVIPECPGFGLSATVSKKTQDDITHDVTHQYEEAGRDINAVGHEASRIADNPFNPDKW